jgi:hypothetical protein
MNIDINLDFLYYQRVAVLDGVDTKEEEYKKTVRVFKRKMKTCKLHEAIQFIILGYKENYAQHKFYSTCFYDVKSTIEDTEYPDYIGKYDFYMSKEEMVRKDIEHIILRVFKDDYKKTNTRYLEELELVFTESQNNLSEAIEEALEEKEFTKNESTESTIYTVEDSAISEIEINPTKFILRTNKEKWKAYY